VRGRHRGERGESKPETCSKCTQLGHVARHCPERQIQKIWPGQFVFQGIIRTPKGSTIEIEAPLGNRGLDILKQIMEATGTPRTWQRDLSNEPG